MPEQKCIICGNIVKFNRGQKVATCEFCETKQEYNGVVEDVVYDEPVVQSNSSLERARSINVEEKRHSIKFEPVGERHVGTTASSKSAMRFGELDEMEKSDYSSGDSPKRNGGVIALIVFLLAIAVGAVILMVAEYDDSDTREKSASTTEWVSSAYAQIGEIEVGQTVSDISVVSDDESMYSAEVDCVYYYDAGEYFMLDTYDTIDEAREYYVAVEFIPKDGYNFDEYTDYYINGESTTAYSGDTIREISIMAVDNSTKTIQISSNWSDTKSSVNGYDVSVKELSYSAEDCVEFTTDFQVTECTKGDTDGNWCIYIRETGGSFYKVNTFYYSGTENMEYITTFDTPTDFDEVVVVPETQKTLSWSHKIYPNDFVVRY